MKIYQNTETGCTCEGFAPPNEKWIQAGSHCDNCRELNDCWQFANYCSTCRREVRERATGETRPYNADCKNCKWEIQCGGLVCDYFTVKEATL